jgi:hypothetical protein
MILRLRCDLSSMIFPAFVVALLCVSCVNSLAVMSVDLGSEWMKVAVVSVSFTQPVSEHITTQYNLYHNIQTHRSKFRQELSFTLSFSRVFVSHNQNIQNSSVRICNTRKNIAIHNALFNFFCYMCTHIWLSLFLFFSM